VTHETGDVRQVIERLRAEAKRNTGNASPLARRARTLCGEAANLLESVTTQDHHSVNGTFTNVDLKAAGRPSLLQVIQEMRGRSYGSKSGADAATLYDWANRLDEWFTNEADAKLTAHPAPSGWQQRIAAMDPWADTQWGARICRFCEVERYRLKGGKQRETPHTPDCLWQNAVDALPPAPEVKETQGG
jgi:hypothetical protein